MTDKIKTKDFEQKVREIKRKHDDQAMKAWQDDAYHCESPDDYFGWEEFIKEITEAHAEAMREKDKTLLSTIEKRIRSRRDYWDKNDMKISHELTEILLDLAMLEGDWNNIQKLTERKLSQTNQP